MELSVKDLILKPENPGPGMLRPMAQRATDAVSLAAFNDLLGQFGQTQRNIADRLSPERDTSPVPTNTSRATDRDDSPQRVTPSRQQDPESIPSIDEGPTDQATSPTDTGTSDNNVDAPATNSENDETSQAAPATGSENNGTTQAAQAAPTTPAVKTTGKPVNTAPQQTAAVPTAVPIEKLGPVASAAVTAAHAIQGGSGQTAPGQAVATAVASAVASAAANRASADPASKATSDTLPQTAKALGLKTVVGSVGTGEAPDTENLPFQGKGNGKNSTAATTASAKATGAGATNNSLPSAATEAPADVDPRAEIAVEKRSAFAQPRSPLATGLLAAQEVANHKSAISQGKTGNAQVGSAGKTGAGVPSGGAQVTPQMAAQQSAVDMLPSSASATAVESVLGQPGVSSTTPILSPSGIFGVGANTAAGSASGTSALAMASARAPHLPSVPVDQFAVHIARAAATGSDQISIKLKPAALGQVEVKFELTHDGRVTAVITAERPDTLDLLQRDSRALERALQEAGLKTDSNSLQFNLRGENGSGRGFENMDGPVATHEGADVADVLETVAELVAGGYQNSRASIGGMDIKV